MKRTSRLVGSLVSLFFSLAGNSLWASTPNAVIIGSVYAKGVPLAGATVRLINATISFSEQQTTDESGTYRFVNVQPSEYYQISVSKSGYQTQIRQGVEVKVGDERVELPPFTLGSPPEPASDLEYLNNALGGVINSRTILTLPLADRDFIDLTLLVPGAYPVEQGSVLQGASLVVNGARATMNNFLLDGADDNDYTINQSLPFQIVEALQEFRVQTSTSSAEYGRSGGAQVNSVSRRGLNQVHGTAFEFLRNSALSADNFFSAYSGGTFDQYARLRQLCGNYPTCVNGQTGDPLTDRTLAKLYDQRDPQLVQNQFGGNLGGPLKEDKLFAFFNWEGFRVADPRPLFEGVPGVALRSEATCPGFVSSVFGKTFPACDPAAIKLFNLYPSPNVPSTAFTDPVNNAFFVGESKNSTSTDNFLERIDWNVSDRATMSFKHNIQRIDQIQGGTVPQTPSYPGNGIQVNGLNQNFSYGWVQRVSEAFNNEFRFGWNRFRLGTFALDRSVDPASLGFQNLNFNNAGLPTISMGGSLASTLFQTGSFLSNLGADLNTPSKRADNVWSWADNLSYSHGTHYVKLGGEVRHIRLNTLNEGLGRGILTFFSAPWVAESGQREAGSIARVNPTFGGGFDRYFSTNSLDWFVQDQWRPRANLSVTLGVRYEVNTAPVELRDRLVNYYPNLGGLVRGGDTAVYDPFGNVIGKSTQPAPQAGFDTDWNNFAPRFGFAWDPRNDGKTVVRGGYAIFFDQQPLELSVNQLYNPPFVKQDFAPTPLQPPATLEDTFGGSSAWATLPFSITARDPNTRTPYVQQFNLGIQRQLGNKALLEVTYVGSLGRKLGRLRDLTPCTLDVFFAKPSDCVPRPVGGDLKGPFFFTSIINEENSSNSSFNSLQARFETRSHHGLQLQASYEWAKSIDNASTLNPQLFLCLPAISNFLTDAFVINPVGFAQANNISPELSLRPTLPIITTSPRIPQDSSNLAGERALSDFDVRNRLVVNYIYDLPRWGRGGRLGQGWTLAGITTIESGQPYTVFDDFFGLPLRPIAVAPVATNNSNPSAAIDNDNIALMSPSALRVAVIQNHLAPGTLGRNSFTGPGLATFDFSVLKNTYLGAGERKNLQFRAEFFNLFNRANFLQPFSMGGEIFSSLAQTIPNNNPFIGQCAQSSTGTCFVPSPFFGQILQARPAREIQFALKFIF